VVNLTPLLPRPPLDHRRKPTPHPHPVVGHVVLDDLSGRYDGILAHLVAAADDIPAAQLATIPDLGWLSRLATGQPGPVQLHRAEPQVGSLADLAAGGDDAARFEQGASLHPGAGPDDAASPDGGVLADEGFGTYGAAGADVDPGFDHRPDVYDGELADAGVLADPRGSLRGDVGCNPMEWYLAEVCQGACN